MLTEARKLAHLGASVKPKRSTFSNAKARRPECIFKIICGDLYKELTSNSCQRRTAKRMKCLHILDSTPIPLI